MQNFSKIKAIVLNLLGLSAFSFKEGKADLTDEQHDELVTQFGEDFVSKFTDALEKELADTSAKDKAKAAEDALTALKAENARKLAESEKKMQTELAVKLAEQQKQFEENLKALSGKAEEDLPHKGSDDAGKKVNFKINPKHRHNMYAHAMMNGGLAADVAMAGDTIDVDDLKTEFGTYLSQQGDGQKEIIRTLTQPTETMKYMTTKVAITEWRASKALVTSVVQQFTSKWTPLGSSTFTPRTIKNYRHKINYPITPDEINDSWLSHLYDERLTPEQMPITKYIINQLVLPKVEEDRELLLIATGVYTEITPAPSDGDAGQATGLSMDGFITQLIAAYEAQKADSTANNINFITLGAITSSNVVDKIEEFVDEIAPLYKRKMMNVFTSEDRYKLYKRAYRDLFPTTKNEDTADMIDFSRQTLKALPSMAGLGHMVCTPKENFIRLVHKNQGASKIFMQTANYDVKVFAEWWEGCGFAIDEAVFAYIDVVQLCNSYAENSDASNLVASMLTDAGCTDVDAANLADYKSAIEAEDGIATLAALQAIVDSVNAATTTTTTTTGA